MRVFRVIVDSSCLIGLARVEQFELLGKLFLEINIPEAVYYEVVVKGKDESGSNETENGIKEGWIKKKPVADRTAVQALSSILGNGESEVIVLYNELNADYALIDEKMARKMAGLMNVNVMGVIGIMDLAIEMGVEVDKKKVVDKLMKSGFRISSNLYKRMFPG
jgi:hypothetical protein